MRTGFCAVPQALTADAANVVKQGVSLARRRGHAQVTPLHVASAMLACPTGILRRACLHSHSHPLQCKALELCFNVGLNRLPASASSPLLGHHCPRPSLSNVLVAAFKRAQAHQRRGSIENLQQPILTLKIEVEQMIISILDDPSVSRIMREAGFSSSQVKSKVEEYVSLDICSQSANLGSQQSKEITKPQVLGADLSQCLSFGQFGVRPSRPLDQVRINEDVMSVLNTLVNKRKNTVIVGGCLASTERVIRGIIEKFQRGQVPGDLRYALFINLPVFSLRNRSKEEVEQKLVKLRCLVKNYVGRGVVLYLGDLKWVSEFWSTYDEHRGNYYCAVEYIITEIKRLVFENGENERLWLMGIATFETYMKCKTGHPSLENMWKLHTFTIPVGSLSLSLNLESDSPTHQLTTEVQRDGLSTWPLLETGSDHHNHITYCSDSSVDFNREAQSKASIIQKKESAGFGDDSSTLPSWLLQYKEKCKRNSNNDQDLCQKWNSFGNKQTRFPEKVLNFFSSSPSSVSISSYERSPNLHQTKEVSWGAHFEPKQPPKEHQFWVSEISEDDYQSSLRNIPKPELLSNPNSSPNSASSSEAEEEDSDCLNSFKAFNDENMKILCNALERKVPWQKEVIPEIARTILQCRSGSSQKQKNLKYRDDKEETWLLLSGADNQGKEKIAREIAKVVFGSQKSFSSIGLSHFTSHSKEESCTKKRARNELGCNFLERFGLALNENPRRVFFMEVIEQVDYCCQKGLKQAIANGIITLTGGEIVPLKDSIIIFSCCSYDSLSTACSSNKRPKIAEDEEKNSDYNVEEKSSGVSLDLNIAIEEEKEEDRSVGDTTIQECVDKEINFKIQEL